ncbi:3-keto-5-aminohexanoate cleavage protein [Aestuariivirga sp. YIM B02566]|uniref:3-keto-5-aminohexanoate cleavage protein n=1 Tax=Taklimakanibacter albus TaxID=2800327 RepID=A0ACC5R4R0_9HYPH|nr:3-keto-5-aminohexanoate cleavage protein [Aestuariivirga sp. YIM B02566]MBK1867598.1 3-keto-5-aminohexanoate cleavage protein [Aestuariivirga sp. YIM B02566]
MTTPCIITVAITGSVPRKEDNPAVPITVAEQIESTQEAFEAGATIAHVHVRKDDQTPTSDPERFARLGEGLRKHCPGMIIQFSTGGRSGKGSERGGMLHLKPDMASLSTGSCNFPTIIYENHPTLVRELADKMMEYGVKPEIEVFDLSMLYQALRLADEGVLTKPLHVQFVFGVKNAMPAIRDVLAFQVSQLNKLMPEATWTAAGIGRHQLEVNRWSLELGGHCRTGLEDNIRIDRDRLAASNAELVKGVAALCGEYGRHPATVSEARQLLGLAATG